jgi:RNA polymerase sigma-54 factor
VTRPSFGPALQQSLGLQQLLLPRMLQSIELLQLPALELEPWLRAEAEENEALELGVRRFDEGPPPPRGPVGSREATDAHDEMMRNQPDPGTGLVGRIEEQLALVEAEPELLAWTRFLVSCIDDHGYLSLADEELLRLGRAQGLRAEPGLLARGIELLQSLEPRGIGARGAVQALLLQLDPRDPEYGLLRTLLVDFLEELARNKLPGVARAMGVSVAALQALLARLGELDMHPAAGLGEERAPVLRPDVLVEAVHAPDRTRTEFEVRLDRANLPSVRLDGDVERLARDRRQATQVRRYLRGKLDRARWVVEALAQRERTLMRVCTSLFEHQRAFLLNGPGHLVPLRMGALADQLELHLSTVSRAVSGKYAQTPWGILALRHFFQTSAGADEESARDDVLEVVRGIFAAENGAEPLSDDQVVDELESRGWKVARRTVAKYRGELGIPSSYRRRIHS